MSLTIYPELEQRSDEWYAQRRGMVTASAVGALVTPTVRVADNDTSRRLVAALVAERITGYSEPSFANDDMWRGILHEPFARAAYSQHAGVDVEQVGFCVRTEPTWTLGSSPDGLIGDNGGLEIKCPRAKTHIQTIVANAVPANNMAQVQACLLVTGRAWWDFVSFCGGLPLFTKRVEPDEKWQATIIAACEAFEVSAAALAADYYTAINGLPDTEPVPDFDDIKVA